jgi:2Fe-2S ferredoxin
VVFIKPDGASVTLDVTEGTTVMQAAVLNEVDGIVGECGGSAMCATCHVYVEGGPRDALPAINAVEEAMLGSVVSPRAATSRLGCQITLTDALDGLVVRLPEAQV